MTDAPRTVSVFISSPGDVLPERRAAERVVRRLDREFAWHFRVQCVLWEQHPLHATESFQPQIPRPRDADLVVTILWNKLGTPLPGDLRGPVTGAVVTGTEYEWEDAWDGFRQTGRPGVSLYLKTKTTAEVQMSEAALAERATQRARLEAFLARWVQGEGGTFKAAFHEFADDVEFETKLEGHLRAELRQMLAGRDGAERRWTRGSPWPGLAPFEAGMEEVFFGRTAEILDLEQRFDAAVAAARGFVLVAGASGAGKSSLVRCGLTGQLRLGRADGPALVRVATLRPGGAGGDPVLALARALMPEPREGTGAAIGAVAGLPELAAAPLLYRPEDLASLLRGEPRLLTRALEQGLSAALATQPSDGRRGARLLVVIDQFEELFTDAAIAEEGRAAFVQALTALAGTGCAGIVATMRSDLLHRLEEAPALLALAEGATLHLAPMGDAQLRDVIERPAALAGIRFEGPDEARGLPGLADRIRVDGAGAGGLLPLLSFLMARLFEADGRGGVLTHASYDALGGLRGALAGQAEGAYAAFAAGRPSGAAQAALARVLRALATAGERADAPLTARAAPLDAFRPGSTEAALVAALTEARLLVVGRDGGPPVVRVAHEAVLLSWSRAQGVLAQARGDLILRDRLEDRAAEWRAAGEERALLLEGVPLAQADAWAARVPDDVTPEVGRFIAASRAEEAAQTAAAASQAAAERRREARERARLRVVAAVLGVLTVVAGGAGVWAFRAQTEAQAAASAASAARLLAEGATEDAYRQLEAARLAQSSWLASEARRARETGDPERALALAATGVPSGAELARAGGWAAPRRPELAEALFETRLQARFVGHTGDVLALAFSPPPATAANTLRILTGGQDGTVRLWDSATAVELKRLGGGHGAAGRVAFAADGRRFAAGFDDGTITVWDGVTAAELGQLRGHRGAVTGLRFLAGGDRLASISADGTGRLWDLTTLAELAVLRGHAGPIVALAAAADGRLATGGDDRTVRVWDGSDGRLLQTLEGHEASVRYVGFSPRGDRLASASADRTARIWQPERPRARPVVLTGHGSRVTLALFTGSASPASAIAEPPADGGQRPQPSPRPAARTDAGERIATASWDNTVRLWDAATGAELRRLEGHGDDVTQAAFSPDGARLATAGNDGTVRLWDAASGAALGVLGYHPERVTAMAFSPDGTSLATAAGDDTSVLWRVVDAEELVLTGHRGSVNTANVSPDGRRIVTAAWDDTARLWDADTGAPIASLEGHRRIVLTAAFSPDGARIATASEDATVRLWDGRDGRKGPTLTGHTAPVAALAWAATGEADGLRLASGSADGTARLWDGATGRAGPVLSHPGGVRALGFSPDGGRLATVGTLGVARIWDATTGAELLRMAPRREPAQSAPGRGREPADRRALGALAWSPDGTRLVTAGMDGTVRVWDATSGAALGVLSGHRGAVLALAQAPGPIGADGWLLASGGADGTARLWRLPEGREVTVLRGHVSPVASVAFRPGGVELATGSFDRTARRWDVGSGAPLAVLAAHSGRVAQVAYTPEGLRLVTASLDNTARIRRLPPAGAPQPVAPLLLPARRLDAVERAAFGVTLPFPDGAPPACPGAPEPLVEAPCPALSAALASPDGAALQRLAAAGLAEAHAELADRALDLTYGPLEPARAVFHAALAVRLAEARLDALCGATGTTTGCADMPSAARHLEALAERMTALRGTGARLLPEATRADVERDLDAWRIGTE